MINNKNNSFTDSIKYEIINQNLTNNQKKIIFYSLINLNGKFFNNLFEIKSISLIIKDEIVKIINSILITKIKIIDKKNNFQLLIYDKNVIEKIKNYKLNINLWGEKEIKSLLIGCFISRGWINSPVSKYYHLEIKINSKNILRLLEKYLFFYKINYGKIIKNNFDIIYIKKSSKISDFLKLINASQSLLYFEDERIIRDIISNVKKSETIEEFNKKKIIKTSLIQKQAIEKLIENKKIHSFPFKYQSISELRIKNLNISLNDLTYIYNKINNKNYSKSTINNWLNFLIKKSKEV